MSAAQQRQHVLSENDLPAAEPALVEEAYDFYGAIRGYLDVAARVADIEPFVQTILSQPRNEIIVNFPVRMDSGEVRLFKGYRVQHNDLLGPFKGGMRFHPSVTLDGVNALAAMMTWKCALMGLPYHSGYLFNAEGFKCPQASGPREAAWVHCGLRRWNEDQSRAVLRNERGTCSPTRAASRSATTNGCRTSTPRAGPRTRSKRS